MGWNGLDLLNDFSAELGDVSSGFKTKVLRWINEGIRDICTAHNWPFLREKGVVILSPNHDAHSIVLAKPEAPTLTALAGGSLTADVSYRVLVTFFEARAQVESIAGDYSTIVPSGSNLAITISDIPVSTSPLVTSRKIYVSKNGGSFQFHGEIANNLEAIEEASLDGDGSPVMDGDGNPVMVETPVTYEITADTASMITPPDESAVHMLDGDLFIDGQRVLYGTSIQDVTYSTSGITSTGTPSLWAPVNEEEVVVYPRPAIDTAVSFYYFKRPARVFGTVTSVPQMPSWLYEDLRRYVIWRGYEFRDRAGKESKLNNYDQGLRVTISRRGKALKRSGRVRMVTPDSDGILS